MHASVEIHGGMSLLDCASAKAPSEIYCLAFASLATHCKVNDRPSREGGVRDTRPTSSPKSSKPPVSPVNNNAGQENSTVVVMMVLSSQ